MPCEHHRSRGHLHCTCSMHLNTADQRTSGHFSDSGCLSKALGLQTSWQFANLVHGTSIQTPRHKQRAGLNCSHRLYLNSDWPWCCWGEAFEGNNLGGTAIGMNSWKVGDSNHLNCICHRWTCSAGSTPPHTKYSHLSQWRLFMWTRTRTSVCATC